MGMIGNSLAQGLISGANIVDGTVDTPDIKDSAVTAAKIATGVVTPGKLSTGAPTWDVDGRLLVGLASSIAGNGIAQIGGTADTRLIIDASSTQGIYFTKSGADNGTFRLDGSGNFQWFIKGSGSANMMLAASTGFIGVNETSPDVALTITKDNVPSKGQIKINASDYGQITFYKSDKTTQVASIFATTSLTAGGINITTPSGGGAILLSTNGVDRWRIATGGNLEAVTVNAGISFNKSGAITNSVLNDYEVGTWTPAVQSGAVTLGTINVATYVKVGRVVTVNAYCDVTTSGDGNSFYLSGLPFTVQSNGYSPSIVDIGTYGVTGAYVRADGGTNQIAFLYPSASAGVSRQPVPGNKVAGYVIFTLTYHTSS